MKTWLIIVFVHNTISQLFKLCTTAMMYTTMTFKMVVLSSTAAGVCQQVHKTRKIKYSIYKKEAVLKEGKQAKLILFRYRKKVEKYTN